MRKIFIDVGAHFGEVTNKFLKNHPDYEAYLFEPNPNNKIPFKKVYRRAVWINNCYEKFYLSKRDKSSEGCSLMKKKTSGNLDKENPIMVKCINFNKWIKDKFKKEDKIVLKMDIEGAEYVVLDHMIVGGSMAYINKLYIEWHWNVIGFNKELHDSLVYLLKNIPTLSLKEEMKI